jgi:hypothetical protein
MVRDKKSTPLNKVIARGAFGAQLTLRQLGMLRMYIILHFD